MSGIGGTLTAYIILMQIHLSVLRLGILSEWSIEQVLLKNKRNTCSM